MSMHDKRPPKVLKVKIVDLANVKNVIAMIPADRSVLPDRVDGIPVPVPTDLYTLKPCEVCGSDAWIGPRQLETYKTDPDGHLAVCYSCAMPIIAGLGGIDNMDLRSLGGGSGVEGRPRF